MVKGCLKVSILFKTDILLGIFSPYKCPIGYPEPFLCQSICLGPDHFAITKFCCTNLFKVDCEAKFF